MSINPLLITSVLLGSLLSPAWCSPVKQAKPAPTGKESKEATVPRKLTDWTGSWKLSPALNQALGYPAKSKRENATFDHPLSFTLSFRAAPKEKIDDGDSLKLFQSEIFDKIDHKVLTTGTWKTKFEVEPGIGTTCIVTESKGATYLWVGAPYVIIYGGRVSFLQGATEEKDALVINFMPSIGDVINRPRSDDTVAFQRVTPEKANP